jgi:hypothetical protein
MTHQWRKSRLSNVLRYVSATAELNARASRREKVSIVASLRLLKRNNNVVVRTFTKRRLALFVSLVVLVCTFASSFAGSTGEDNVSCLPAVVFVFAVILISIGNSVVLESPLAVFQPSLRLASLRAPPQS